MAALRTEAPKRAVPPSGRRERVACCPGGFSAGPRGGLALLGTFPGCAFLSVSFLSLTVAPRSSSCAVKRGRWPADPCARQCPPPPPAPRTAAAPQEWRLNTGRARRGSRCPARAGRCCGAPPPPAGGSARRHPPAPAPRPLGTCRKRSEVTLELGGDIKHVSAAGKEEKRKPRTNVVPGLGRPSPRRVKRKLRTAA